MITITDTLTPATEQDQPTTVRSEFNIQRACVWLGGPLALLGMAIGQLGLARFVPPPSPAHSAERIAAIYASRSGWIMAGAILTCFMAALWAPFTVVLSRHLKRMEGEGGILSATQLVLGTILILEFFVPLTIMIVAAFRPDLPASTIQMLNDMAQIFWVGLTYSLVLEVFVIGLAVLRDSHETPIFPRWVGYLNLVFGTLWVASPFLAFFKQGPLAWNGLLLWWVALAIYVIWIGVMTFAMLKAIDSEESEAIARNGADGTLAIV